MVSGGLLQTTPELEGNPAGAAGARRKTVASANPTAILE
jgi:hypothetical protein